MVSQFIRHITKLTLVAGAFALATSPVCAQTAAFPEKTVKILVPFAPGGASDVMTRQIAEGLREIWQQPVIVDFKPGASGIVAADAVAKADPDGYTALIHVSGMVLLPALNNKVPFDPLKDFAPVSQVATMALAYVASPSLEVKNLAEFIALAKSKPGQYNYGSFGAGSAGHLYMEILKDAAGLDIFHVPYKGEQPVLTELLGGHISTGIVSLPGAVPYANSGKVVPLAVTGPIRTQQLPNTPTFIESGFRAPGLESISWYAVFLPAKTPKHIVQKFSNDLKIVLAKPEIRQRMQDYGITMTGTTPEELGEMMKVDSARWTKVIQEKHIRLE